MKIRLTRRTRVWHNAGDIVEVSPVEAAFLMQVCSAESAEEEPAEEKKTSTKKKK